MTGGKPWYREFWLWFVMAPVIATVIGGFATLIIAGAPPALVVDDYGEIALVVERERERDQHAAALGLVAELQLGIGPNEGAGAVVVRLAGARPARVRLDLIHPTRDERDASVLLDHAGDAYRGVVRRPAGRLYLQLTDDQGSWRLTGELGPTQQSTRLEPAAAR